MKTGLYIPTKETIEGLTVGSLVPNCFGIFSKVTEIFGRGVDMNGKAFVCFHQDFGSGSTISNSLVEGKILRTVPLTAKHASAEIDGMELAYHCKLAGGNK